MNTPKKAKLFKNDQARIDLQNWYNRFLEKIETTVKRETVSTSFGTNHVLFAGDDNKPPLICLHAMMSSSAHSVSVLWKLSEQFQIIAPDIPGQSVMGQEMHLPFNAYGHWLNEIAEKLQLQSFNMMGISWGGFITIKYALEFPEKVNKMGLLVPAGIVRGKVVAGLLKMALPAIRFKINQSEKNLKTLLDPIMTTFDKDWTDFMGDMFLKFKPDMRIPPLFTDDELRSIKIPALVIGADQDISFPGIAMLDRVKKVMHDVETELLINSRHCPPLTEEFSQWLVRRSGEFFGL